MTTRLCGRGVGGSLSRDDEIIGDFARHRRRHERVERGVVGVGVDDGDDGASRSAHDRRHDVVLVGELIECVVAWIRLIINIVDERIVVLIRVVSVAVRAVVVVVDVDAAAVVVTAS